MVWLLGRRHNGVNATTEISELLLAVNHVVQV